MIKGAEVDWGDVRVICLAPGYRKYDLHAVKMMGANIELWQYRLFERGALYLEEVFRRAGSTPADNGQEGKNPVMVAAGKKAAITRATGAYSFDEHSAKADKSLVAVVGFLRDHILGLGDVVEEASKKFYVAYKVAKNFVCLEVRKTTVLLYLKVDPTALRKLPPNARDVSKIGHFGTGDLELAIKTVAEAKTALPLIRQAFESVGG